MSATATVLRPQAAPAEPIKVMVVDDSVVVRGLVSRWIEAEPDLAVAASARTGRDAVERIERADPDVVVLDVEMPELDGLAALPLLLAKKRDLVVIMASTLTRRNAEVSLKALSLGAADYVPKPETNRGVTTSLEFRQTLTAKVRELGARALKQRARRPALRESRPAAPAPSRVAPASSRAAPAASRPAPEPGPRVPLRATSGKAPRVLLIGSSTGGPQALMKLIAEIGPVIDAAPVLITQHMPPTFTTILAEHLARVSGRPAHEAVDGEPVQPGAVYVAPGGKHMTVARRGGQAVIKLDDGPPVNFCKPAVDPLFASASEIWGAGTLSVVLTGMGSDGTNGARKIVAAGGAVLAQDEATSVVWGMPGSVANAGLCAAVLPIDQIAPKVIRMFSGEPA